MSDPLRRVAEALLAALVPPGAAREGLLGDLAELRAARARDRGRGRAALWYAREVAWALARYAPGGLSRLLRARRHGNGGDGMTGVAKDFAIAARRLARAPGFTLAVVVTVGLGIGANTAVFSVFRGVLLRPLPFPDPDRIVSVYEMSSELDITPGWSSIPNFADWRSSATSFEAIALFRGRSASIGTDERPRYVYTALVTSDFFRVFGVEPELGRGFTEGETGPDGASVVVIGQGLWRRGFGGDPDVVGRTVHIDGAPMTIAGVMPAGFDAPSGFIDPTITVDVWLPFPLDPASVFRGDRSYNAVARLAPGRTLADARLEMEALAASLAERHPDANASWSTRVRTWQDMVVGPFRPALALLMGLVVLVLLVTCANVANLMVSRALGRESEMATMAALGAGRARVLRGLFVEALLLSVVGAGVGLLLGVAGVEAFRAFEPGLVPRLDAVRMDAAVLVFGLGASLGSGVAFGAAAALAVASLDPARSLSTARAGVRPGRRRMRAALAAGQLGTAFALLVAAGLLGRSFRALRSVDLGFDTDGVTAATVALSWSRVPGREARDAFVGSVLQELRETPGIESAAMINSLPLSGSMQQLPVRVGGFGGAEDEEVVVSLRATSPGYPATMGIPILDGRDFGSADVAAPGTVLVNRTLAERLWGGRSPIGGTVTFGDGTRSTIVGVVGDVRHHGPDEPPRPEVYRPYTVDGLTSKSFVVRAALPPAEVHGALDAAVAAVDPDQPVREVRPMRVWAEQATAAFRFEAALVATAAGLAIALAALGLFSTLAGIVAESRREIALRLALGADAGTILTELARRMGRLVTAGLGLGVVLALGLAGVLRGFLFGIGATDPTVFAWVLAGCLGVATLAAIIPARQALAVEPARALRDA